MDLDPRRRIAPLVVRAEAGGIRAAALYDRAIDYLALDPLTEPVAAGPASAAWGPDWSDVGELRQGPDGAQVSVSWASLRGYQDFVRAETTRTGSEIRIRLLVSEAVGNYAIVNDEERVVELGALEPGEYVIRVNDWAPVTRTLSP